MTKVAEGRACVDLEGYGGGFVSGAMGDCSFLAVFWNQMGTEYQNGRAIHGSGGLIPDDLAALIEGVPDAGSTFVYVTGTRSTVDDPGTMDGRFCNALQTLLTTKGWRVQRHAYQAGSGNFVVTKKLDFATEEAFQKDAAAVAKEAAKAAKCCTIL